MLAKQMRHVKCQETGPSCLDTTLHSAPSEKRRGKSALLSRAKVQHKVMRMTSAEPANTSHSRRTRRGKQSMPCCQGCILHL